MFQVSDAATYRISRMVNFILIKVCMAKSPPTRATKTINWLAIERDSVRQMEPGQGHIHSA